MFAVSARLLKSAFRLSTSANVMLPCGGSAHRHFHRSVPCCSLKPFLADTDLLKYTTDLSTRGPAYMDYMYQTSIHTFPEETAQMVTPVQARFLTFLVRIVQARKILEIGCLLGFSTLALAEGCKEFSDASVLGLEKDLIYARLARKHVDMAKLSDLVEIRVGPALQQISKLDSSTQFDFIFLDANKSGYIDYYDAIMDNNLLSKNGLLCVDNVLFKGYVHPILKDAYKRPEKRKYSKQEDKQFTKEELQDVRYQKIAARLKEFNRHVNEDPTTEQLILPMFDGMMLIWKRRPGRNAWAVD